MARIFLSMVSAEFKSYRQRLSAQLRTAGQEPVDQDHFADTGARLLALLDEGVRTSDHVIHLVGHGTGYRLADGGSAPPRQQLEEFADAKPDFLARSGLARYAGQLDRLSYTQFEYWLGRYYGKNALIYVAEPTAPRDPGFRNDAAQRAEQDDHLQRIADTFVQRGTVECGWSLVSRVLVSLCAAGTIPVSRPHEHPAIVLGFAVESKGFRSSGAVRWHGRTIPTAADAVVDADDRGVMCDRLTDLIRRGHRALGGQSLGARKTVLELVLPEELLTRPLDRWEYRHERAGRQPVRAWHPVRLRLAEAVRDESRWSNIACRLELLSENREEVAAVHRAGEPDLSAATRPVAVVHDGQAADSWHATAVVCGGFAAPPVRPRKGARKLSAVVEAIFRGVPYLIWPDGRVGPEELEVRLSSCRRPAELCLRLERERFVVFAEDRHPPFPDGSPLYSERTPGGRA